MLFNRKAAEAHLTLQDRDRAPFFAGREDEIQSFRQAVKTAAESRQAIFRIYRGAPGCGKTSLAAQLSEIHADDVLFVPCELEDLADSGSLARRIERAALDRGSRATRAGAVAATTLGDRLGLRPLAEVARKGLASAGSRNTTLVLHLDEAHARVQEVGKQLVALHTTGAGVPCVVLLTGLDHTATRVRSISGLSRLADSTDCPMGPLSPGECAESLLAMLSLMCPHEPLSLRESLAAQTAPMAHGWPQHLHCVQAALCQELLRVDGALRHVDLECMQEESDEKRYAYYRGRIDFPIFRIDTNLTKRLLMDIDQQPVNGLFEIEDICEQAIERAGLTERFLRRNIEPTHFADALTEKGVLTQDRDGYWSLAIPSMAEWVARSHSAPSV